MRLAGYTGADSYLKKKAEELLREPLVLEALKKRDLLVATTRKVRMDRTELQDFWSSVVKNHDPYHVDEIDPETNVPKPKGPIPMQQRLKAAELFGKSEGMFVDKVDMTTNVTITDLVSQSLHSKRSLEDIEAEYEMARNPDPIPQLPSLSDVPELPQIDPDATIDDLI